MAEWDFKIFVGCESKLIGCRKQFPKKKYPKMVKKGQTQY